MSIGPCLTKLVSAGKISQQQANDARAIHDGILNDDLLRDMDQATKEGYAAKRTAEVLDERAKANKMNLAMTVNKHIENTKRIDAHPNGAIPGLMAIYDQDFRNAPGARRNVTSLEREAYLPAIINKVHEFDERYASKMVGLKQDTDGIRNWVYETFGVDSGDQAAKAAHEGTKNANEWAIAKAMQLDRRVKNDPEWGRPQRWEADRVRKFGRAEFATDWERFTGKGGGVKIFDPKTFQVAKDAADQARIIKEAAEHIQKDRNAAGRSVSPFKPEMRVFRFSQNKAGADAYLFMMDKYGAGRSGYFSMMQSHYQATARELAMLDVFGPNYHAATEGLTEYAIEKSAEQGLDQPVRKIGEKIVDFIPRLNESPWAAKGMQKFMTGQLSGVENQLMATTFGGIRSFMTAAKLGGAPLSAIPGDTVLALVAANSHGFDAGRLLHAIVRNYSSISKDAEREALAMRLGIITHTVSQEAITSARFGDELIGRGIFQKVATGVIRVSTLHHWDDAVRTAFSHEFLASFGDRVGTSFEKLDEPFARFLKDFGFGADDWAKISAAQTLGPGPVKFLLPSSIADEALQMRLLSAAGDVKRFGYLSGGSNRVAAIATWGAPRGTFAREVAQSAFQFKTFSATMLFTHVARAIQEAGQGRLGYLGALAPGLLVAGAVTIQARQLFQLKDPQDMTDPYFWARAWAQGGGGGILGDFLNAAISSRNASTLAETLGGPWVQALTVPEGLVSSARRRLVEGENVNIGGQIAKDIQDFFPGGGLWYLRGFFSRFIFDSIRKLIDPQYARSFSREKQSAEKYRKQKFYWEPGELTPSRPPDMGAMFGK